MIIKEHRKLINGGNAVNGALPSDSTAEFSLCVERSAGISEIKLHIFQDDGEEFVFSLKWRTMIRGMEIWSVVIPGLKEGLYYYQYETLGNQSRFWGGEDRELLRENESRQLLIYRSGFATPEKLRGAMIYHVFVDRFFKGSHKVEQKSGTLINDDWYEGIPQFGEYPGAEVKNNEFFGGTLWGICEKLDYIKSLGVDYIYLSPVFDAASNHKYDTGDYLTVDKMFGGDDALEHLVKEAEKSGIGVILDGVFNHTGDDSVYFNRKGTYPSLGAYNSEESEYSDWYNFRSRPDDYECWWGVKILPRVDSSNRSYKSFICDKVAKKWMDMGIAGWRLDVADELSDGFLYDFRSAIKKYNEDSFIIGEVWEDASNKESYGKRRKYLQGAQLDSVMNYPFRDGVISYIKYGDWQKFAGIVNGICRRYPETVLCSLMNFLGTHDTARIITVLGGDDPDGHSLRELSEMKMTEKQYDKAVRMVICAYYLIGILPGALSVYYGDEAGMEGYSDPFCRRPYPWGRTNEEILSVIRKIGSIRKEEAVFKAAELSIIELNSDFAVISRSYAGSTETVVCVINRSGRVLAFDSSESFRVLGTVQKETVRSIKIMPTDGVYIKFDKGLNPEMISAKLIPPSDPA